MIRPLTIVTFLMACGSGLYLYQSKHDAQVLDRTIEKTVRDTAALREQSRLLSTEWTMLNDPDTLRHFADIYLSVKSIAPSQFTSLADLDSRLPPIRPPNEAPSHGMDDDAPQVASAATAAMPPMAAQTSAAPADVGESPEPATHRPAVTPSVAAIRPAEKKLAAARPAAVEAPTEQRSAAAADGHPTEQHVADARSADPHPPHPSEVRAAEVRTGEVRTGEARLAGTRAAYVAGSVRPTVLAAAPRPNPPAVYAPAPYVSTASPSAPYPSSPGPYTGSLLGMAHAAAPPAPRPTPVYATQWSNPD